MQKMTHTVRQFTNQLFNKGEKMAKFTTRVTNENGVIKAWVDQDGQICIEQPWAPGSPAGSTWASESEAKAWADQHASDLEAAHEEGLLRQAQEEAMLEQAKIDSQKIAEIHEMLSALNNK